MVGCQCRALTVGFFRVSVVCVMCCLCCFCCFCCKVLLRKGVRRERGVRERLWRHKMVVGTTLTPSAEGPNFCLNFEFVLQNNFHGTTQFHRRQKSLFQNALSSTVVLLTLFFWMME